MQSRFTHFVSDLITKNHLELKKIFIWEYVYVVNRDPCGDDTAIWDLHDICNTVRYKDVTDRVATAPALAVDADATLGAGSVAIVAMKGNQRPCCLRQVLHSHQPQVLQRANGRHPYTALHRRYHVGPKWQGHHR